MHVNNGMRYLAHIGLVLVLAAVPAAAKNNGIGDVNMPADISGASCGDAMGCHSVSHTADKFAISSSASDGNWDTPGESGTIVCTVNIDASSGNLAGVMLLNDTLGPVADNGWTITADPNSNGTPFSYNEITAAGDQVFSWSVTAPGVIGDYGITARLFFGNGSAVYDTTATLTFPGLVPVELASFTAAVSDAGAVLSWATVSEQGNLGFNVFRKSGSEQEFTRINAALIPGAGTTAEPQEYTFTDGDFSSLTGTVSYYLQQVDLNGSTENSPVITVDGGATAVAGGMYHSAVMPDAFTLHHIDGEVVFRRNSTDGEAAVISIYNGSGRLVRSLKMDEAEVRWDGKDMSGADPGKGIYYYHSSGMQGIRRFTRL